MSSGRVVVGTRLGTSALRDDMDLSKSSCLVFPADHKRTGRRSYPRQAPAFYAEPHTNKRLQPRTRRTPGTRAVE